MPVERLTALDASFLYLEKPGVHMHVAGLSVVGPRQGGSRLTYDDVERTVGARLRLAPRLRRKLLAVPGNISRPVWVDDDRFNPFWVATKHSDVLEIEIHQVEHFVRSHAVQNDLHERRRVFLEKGRFIRVRQLVEHDGKRRQVFHLLDRRDRVDVEHQPRLCGPEAFEVVAQVRQVALAAGEAGRSRIVERVWPALAAQTGSTLVSSQDDQHARYGGVVPEIASRAHVEMLTPVVAQALVEAGLPAGRLHRVYTDGEAVLWEVVRSTPEGAAGKALLAQFRAFDSGAWARSKRSLLCACVFGVASERQRATCFTRSKFARGPGSRSMIV